MLKIGIHDADEGSFGGSETRTLLRADRTHFHVEAKLEAFENETVVFSRSWMESIPRDFN